MTNPVPEILPIPVTAIGLITIDRVDKRTGERVRVVEKQNVLVDNFFEVVLDLIDQQAGDVPALHRISSMWVESDNVGLPPATGTDDGPHPGSTVMLQYVFADADRILTTVNTALGPLNGLQMRATVDGNTYAGNVIVAAGLYTRGDALTPPNPGTWSPGDQNVRMVARQLVGPLTIEAGFVFELGWTVAMGRLPDALL